jgi:hypothetical protein
MVLSRVFGCFKDPDARASRKQKKAGKRTQDSGEIPNRVVSAARTNHQGGMETRNLPPQTIAPVIEEPQTFVPAVEEPQIFVPTIEEPQTFAPAREEPQPFAPAVEEPPDIDIPLVVEDQEPEPWSVGAIARRTSQLEPQLIQAISQANRGRERAERMEWIRAEYADKALGDRWAQLGGLPTRVKNPGVAIRYMTEEEEEFRRE